MICVPVVATTTDEALAKRVEAERWADVVEIRFDHIADPDVARILAGRAKPVIATNRLFSEGGARRQEDEARLAVLEEAIRLGAEYVDVELSSFGKIHDFGRSRVICSYHNFDRLPSDLSRIHRTIVDTGCDVAKVVVMVRDIRDNLALFSLLEASDHPTIALGMGRLGLVSRILGRKFGNYLTFGALDADSGSAPGQPGLAELAEVYRYKRIKPQTQVYGLIANPIGHSLSPAIMNAAFEHAGLEKVYVPFEVEDPVAFINAFKGIDVQGYSVTIPHKSAVMLALDEIDPLARRIGAVNTIANRSGRLFGSNTDMKAALAELEKAFARASDGKDGDEALSGRRILIAGAGGAGRAIAVGLADRGAFVTVVDIDRQRASEVAETADCSHATPEEAFGQSWDGIVNATPLGMLPDTERSAIPAGVLKHGVIAFDVVYNPLETFFLRQAKAAGCIVAYGFDMFVGQAAAQFEEWTGTAAPKELMAAVVQERLRG